MLCMCVKWFIVRCELRRWKGIGIIFSIVNDWLQAEYSAQVMWRGVCGLLHWLYSVDMGVGGASVRIERQLSASWSAARLRSGPRPAGRVRRGVTRCCASGTTGARTSTTLVLEVGVGAGVDSAGADTDVRRVCFARNAACLRARLLVSTAGHAARMCAFAASAYASGPAGRSARRAAGAYMRG